MMDLAEIPCIKRTITLCEVADQAWRLQLAIDIDPNSEHDQQIWDIGFGADGLTFSGVPLRLLSAGRGLPQSTYYLEGEVPPNHSTGSRYDFLWRRGEAAPGAIARTRLKAEQVQLFAETRRQLREELMELGKEVGSPAWLEDSLKALMGVPAPSDAPSWLGDLPYGDPALGAGDPPRKLRLTGPRPMPIQPFVGPAGMRGKFVPEVARAEPGDLAVAMLNRWEAEMAGAEQWRTRRRPSWWLDGELEKCPAVLGDADHVAPAAMTKPRAADEFDLIRNRTVEINAVRAGKDFLVYRDHATEQTIFMKPLSERAEKAMQFCPGARLESDPGWYSFRSFPTGADPTTTEHVLVEFGPTL